MLSGLFQHAPSTLMGCSKVSQVPNPDTVTGSQAKSIDADSGSRKPQTRLCRIATAKIHMT
jgi:hypothetical protein